MQKGSSIGHHAPAENPKRGSCSTFSLVVSESALPALNGMAASSFEKFTTQYTQRIDKLIRCSQLLGVENCTSSLQLLADINEEVTQLEELATSQREALERDRSMLNDMKTLTSSAEETRRQLEHASQNIPAHLPDFSARGGASSSGNSTANVSKTSSVSSMHGSEASSTTSSVAVDNRQPQAPHPAIGDMSAASRKVSAATAHAHSLPALTYITLAEFNDVPKYIRGRLAYDSVNMAVECLNQAYSFKYQLIAVPKSQLTDAEIKKRKAYRAQEMKDVEGKHFITDHDIRTTTSFKVDTQGRAIIALLRHCKRLKEVHGGGFTRYVIYA
ncbi:spindle and kinetochore-associated protein 1-like [Sycon ciliatum]|uniref:spindle and kinetochore-associated protein 1-like n=1 Tax=Sycon ciliatum TaxID=27933 RepID=UPI0031F61385